jgi:hypothetical protein
MQKAKIHISDISYTNFVINDTCFAETLKVARGTQFEHHRINLKGVVRLGTDEALQAVEETVQRSPTKSKKLAERCVR